MLYIKWQAILSENHWWGPCHSGTSYPWCQECSPWIGILTPRMTSLSVINPTNEFPTKSKYILIYDIQMFPSVLLLVKVIHLEPF